MKSNLIIPRPWLAFALTIIIGCGKHPSTISGAKNHEKSISFHYPALFGQAIFRMGERDKSSSAESHTAPANQASKALNHAGHSQNIGGFGNQFVGDHLHQAESGRLEHLEEISMQTNVDGKLNDALAEIPIIDHEISSLKDFKSGGVESQGEKVRESRTSFSALNDLPSSHFSFLMYSILAFVAVIAASVALIKNRGHTSFDTEKIDEEKKSLLAKSSFVIADEMEDPVKHAEVGIRKLGKSGMSQSNPQDTLVEHINKAENCDEGCNTEQSAIEALNTAKAALVVRVSELEAQASKDKASTGALDTAKAALVVRVRELEAQVAKDEAKTVAHDEEKAALTERVSELEEQISLNEDDAAMMYDAKKELVIRVSELEAQSLKDKASAVAVHTAKTALDVRVSELEKKVTLSTKEKDEVDAVVLELRDTMALHAADLIKTSEAYAARELSLERLVKAKVAELGGLQERLDRLVLAQDSRDKENQNNLMIIKEHREKKGFLEATTTELKYQVGELEAQRDRLRVKAAHARFGARQSEGVASRPGDSVFQRESGASAHGAFDLHSSEADNFNMDNMGDFSDSDCSMLPDVFTDPDTTTTAIDSSFDADSDMDRSRISEVAKKAASTVRGDGGKPNYLDLDPLRNRRLSTPDTR